MLVPNLSSCAPMLHARLSLMKNREARLPCTQVLSSPPRVVNGAFRRCLATRWERRRESSENRSGPNRLSIPGKRRIEIVDQISARRRGCSPRRTNKAAEGETAVEQRVDGVGVRSLQAGVRLKTKPRCVVLVEVVVDASRFAPVRGRHSNAKCSAGSRSHSHSADCQPPRCHCC